ncbi:MAG TPA: carboxypeptidase-like regulatory domain-containing protein, partial [Chitinophagaceae bacterium]|nr:carboxypeptidase-like regulatory domain-containing protein [Chitinophagaceae bacterium]
MKRILVMIVPVVLILLAFRPVKSHTVTGKVTDETGAALAGVSVHVKGTSTGVSSDVNGSFRITAPGSNSTLVFSAAGYVTAEIKINGRTSISITL